MESITSLETTDSYTSAGASPPLTSRVPLVMALTPPFVVATLDELVVLVVLTVVVTLVEAVVVGLDVQSTQP